MKWMFINRAYDNMKIVATSDTHGTQPTLPDGDLLIHCGDACNHGTMRELEGFVEWYSSQPHKYKIFVPGNHDIAVEQNYAYLIEIMKSKGVTLLADREVDIEGVKIFGCPWTPEFFDWAFMKTRKKLEQYWSLCDSHPDILISHGPPYGILDVVDDENVGCAGLRRFVMRRRPKHHFFGHIHCSKGSLHHHKTKFHNVACRVEVVDI